MLSDGSDASVWRLPTAVRARLVRLAADRVGALPPEDVPAALAAVRRFTPSKRARTGAAPLARALAADPAFRAAVAQAARLAQPDLARAVEAGEPPADADPVDLAALAWLLRPNGWADQLEGAGARLGAVAGENALEAALAEVRRLSAALVQARTDTGTALAAAQADVERARADAAVARREARGATEALRRAEAVLADHRSAASEAAQAARQRGEAEATELRRLTLALAVAQEAAEAGRRAERQGRARDETGLRLLLDTLLATAQGLRRELALPPAEQRPADYVAADLATALGAGGASSAGIDLDPFAGVPGQGRAPDDPTLLRDLLDVPGVHLVVDGYNVTKTGYPGSTLEAQRSRLLSALAPLTARTGAEVTVVFDGAERVPGTPTIAAPRGVRLIFSPAGVLADEIVVRLTRAEPAGRAVVVVSSDREIADAVRRLGARPAAARALVALLDTGGRAGT